MIVARYFWSRNYLESCWVRTFSFIDKWLSSFLFIETYKHRRATWQFRGRNLWGVYFTVLIKRTIDPKPRYIKSLILELWAIILISSSSTLWKGSLRSFFGVFNHRHVIVVLRLLISSSKWLVSYLVDNFLLSMRFTSLSS